VFHTSTIHSQVQLIIHLASLTEIAQLATSQLWPAKVGTFYCSFKTKGFIQMGITVSCGWRNQQMGFLPFSPSLYQIQRYLDNSTFFNHTLQTSRIRLLF
jgi:hypothetical protein